MDVPNHPTITTNGVLRPTHAYIDLEKICQNLVATQQHVGKVQVMPILKANAYGHGLVEVARHIGSDEHHGQQVL